MREPSWDLYKSNLASTRTFEPSVIQFPWSIAHSIILFPTFTVCYLRTIFSSIRLHSEPSKRMTFHSHNKHTISHRSYELHSAMNGWIRLAENRSYVTRFCPVTSVRITPPTRFSITTIEPRSCTNESRFEQRLWHLSMTQNSTEEMVSIEQNTFFFYVQLLPNVSKKALTFEHNRKPTHIWNAPNKLCALESKGNNLDVHDIPP